jgi:hypothetical protein
MTLHPTPAQTDPAETRLRCLRAALNAQSDPLSAVLLQMLRIMRDGDWTTDDASRAMPPVSRYPNLSRARPHIVALRERGLIAAVGQQGRHTLYRITATGIAALAAQD